MTVIHKSHLNKAKEKWDIPGQRAEGHWSEPGHKFIPGLLPSVGASLPGEVQGILAGVPDQEEAALLLLTDF